MPTVQKIVGSNPRLSVHKVLGLCCCSYIVPKHCHCVHLLYMKMLFLKLEVTERFSEAGNEIRMERRKV
jgi:hypothetical protein